MATDTLNVPAGAAQLPNVAELLARIEHVRKGAHLLLILSSDDTVDALFGNAINFTSIEIEAECEAIAAGLSALCPA